MVRLWEWPNPLQQVILEIEPHASVTIIGPSSMCEWVSASIATRAQIALNDQLLVIVTYAHSPLCGGTFDFVWK